MSITPVLDCEMADCVYKGAKHAGHIIGMNVGSHAECATYIRRRSEGEDDEAVCWVGACMASDCRFNDHLECHAPSINVGSHNLHADCKTFLPRSGAYLILFKQTGVSGRLPTLNNPVAG